MGTLISKLPLIQGAGAIAPKEPMLHQLFGSKKVIWITVTKNVKVSSMRYKKCNTTRHDKKLEKVAVAMHCNLKPSDIAPVVVDI